MIFLYDLTDNIAEFEKKHIPMTIYAKFLPINNRRFVSHCLLFIECIKMTN